MARALFTARRVIFCLLTAGVSGAQEPALERVKSESAQLRQFPSPSESDIWKTIKAARDRSAGLHAAVRDWIESLLPKSEAALDAEFPFVNARVQADLQRSGLVDSDRKQDDFKPGSVSGITLSRPPEDLDKIAVTVGIDVPCGSDEAVYVYDYSQGEPRRILESHGIRDHDETISDVRFSKRDAIGNQLILTLRYAVQCGSSWNMLSYDLFRFSATANTAVPILGGEHGIWFGADNPYQLRLEPDDLLMEVRDKIFDGGIHNRAHVLHFKVDGSTAARIDPVALKPQDFVDEWLTRPWAEMESRSAEGESDKLKKWHEVLAGDFVGGYFRFVQQCQEKINQWQIGIGLGWIQGKELPETLGLNFLVEQSEQYRFKMVDISFNRQEGCPGESQPSPESPTLFPVKEKAR